MAQVIQLLLNKNTPHFQLLPMSKIDQSLLRIHEVPPLQIAKSQVIQDSNLSFCSTLNGFVISDPIIVFKTFVYILQTYLQFQHIILRREII